MRYRTKDGDVLDLLCRHIYREQPHSVEAVLAANPGLAAHGPILPAGVEIDFPAAPIAAPTTIRLWGSA